MKKLPFPGRKTVISMVALGISLYGGFLPASAAVIAQTFEPPLAPNTLSFGPSAVAGYGLNGIIYRFQWRLAPFAVDLDSNGTTDLTIVGTEGVTDTMRVSLTGRNETWAFLAYSNGVFISSYASAFKRGSEAGPSLTSGDPRIGWFNDADAPAPAILTVGDQGTPIEGSFLPGAPFEQKFLGVRFEREGAMHYGWVGISGYANIGQELYIHAWAYESEPDTAIIVGQIPEPAAGLLAAVSGLLVGLRRKGKPGA